MIPKIFHILWFSENPEKNYFNQEQINNIQTWLSKNPSFLLKIWTNNDFIDTDFKINCIKNRKFATLSNYLRLEILYKYGGIYLDDDIVCLKPVDSLLNDNCFFGVDHVDDNLTVINNAVIGAEPKNWFIDLLYNKFLKKYNYTSHAINSAGYHIIEELKPYGFNKGYKNSNDANSVSQLFNGVKIYQGDYFYPRYGGNGFTNNTVFDHKYFLRH